MHIDIPCGIQEIMDTLERAGYEAWLAGGCVRDALLGNAPHDFDIATNAVPEQVIALFDHTVPTGLQHGTVTVLEEGEAAEVTTFRAESAYRDHRRPDAVLFVGNLQEDLSRRDFTINAMAYSPKRGLADLFGGQEDLRNGIIRAVGDPKRRFEEDALRMFRAFRFAARYGFEIEEKTLDAIHEKEALSSYLSAERVRKELEEVMQTDPGRIEDMAGLLRPWIPEIEQMGKMEQNSVYHYTDVLHHTLDAMKAADTEDRIVLWALLLHDTGKLKTKKHYNGKDHFPRHEEESAKIAKRVMKTFKMDREAMQEVPKLVADHDTFYAPRPVSLYKFCVQKKYTETQAERLFAVQRGDILAHAVHERMRQLEAFEQFYESAKGIVPLSLKELKISGKDVLENTDLRGEKISQALDFVLHEAICSEAYRTREAQLERLALFARQESGGNA